MEKSNSQVGPDAWKPGVFGMFNIKAIRETNGRRWIKEAKAANKDRPIHQRLFFLGRTSAKAVMCAEADRDNRAFDKAKKEGKVPDFLYSEELSRALLDEHMIEERYFPTVEELQEALRDAPVPHGVSSYHYRRNIAGKRVRGELPGTAVVPVAATMDELQTLAATGE